MNSFRFTMGHKKLWYFFVECNSLEQISALKTILMGTNIVKKESFLFKTFTEKINCYSNMNELKRARYRRLTWHYLKIFYSCHIIRLKALYFIQVTDNRLLDIIKNSKGIYKYKACKFIQTIFKNNFVGIRVLLILWDFFKILQNSSFQIIWGNY